MNALKKILLLNVILCFGYASPAEQIFTKIQECIQGQAKFESGELKRMQDLWERTLKTAKPSGKKRFFVGATKELVKLAAIFTCICIKNCESHDESQDNILTTIIVISALIPLIADLLIHTKDASLASLQEVYYTLAAMPKDKRAHIMQTVAGKKWLEKLTDKLFTEIELYRLENDTWKPRNMENNFENLAQGSKVIDLLLPVLVFAFFCNYVVNTNETTRSCCNIFGNDETEDSHLARWFGAFSNVWEHRNDSEIRMKFAVGIIFPIIFLLSSSVIIVTTVASGSNDWKKIQVLQKIKELYA